MADSPLSEHRSERGRAEVRAVVGEASSVDMPLAQNQLWTRRWNLTRVVGVAWSCDIELVFVIAVVLAT